MSLLQVDSLYEGFVSSLPNKLRAVALDLPYFLKLAPTPGLRFSEVFSHEVTLGAPLLAAQAFPSVPMELVRAAGLAHILAVVEAFGADRIADEQVECSAELLSLLERLREARDRALDRVLPGAALEAMQADARTGAAIAEERWLLARANAVDWQIYDRVSLGKQAVGFPASLALARAAGATGRQIEQLNLLLSGVWLGLQFEDDVVDWEDDWRRNGAWAVCLARGYTDQGEQRGSTLELVRSDVLHSGTLSRMLRRARQRYRAARRHARSLGAHRLSAWAAQREARLEGLIPLESRFAGYAVRARSLGSWAAETLT